MKKFNKIILKNNEIDGIGYFQKLSGGIMIEAQDNSIKEYFLINMRDSPIIGGIGFEGEESNGAFAGDFLISNIKGNEITLKKI